MIINLLGVLAEILPVETRSAEYKVYLCLTETFNNSELSQTFLKKILLTPFLTLLVEKVNSKKIFV